MLWRLRCGAQPDHVGGEASNTGVIPLFRKI